MFKMPTYLKNTPGSQSLGRQRSRATPGNKICNNVFCQLNEIVGINNNVCAFLCSVCTCQPVQHSWRRWRGSPGTSWCCGHLASQPRSIFSPRSRTRSRPRLPSVSPAQRVSPIRCKQLGAQNQVHTGRWSQVLQEGGGRILPVKDGLPRHPWERPSRPRPLVEGSSGGWKPSTSWRRKQ